MPATASGDSRPLSDASAASFLDGREPDVDGRRCQSPALEPGPVLLDNGFAETAARLRPVPVEEVVECL